LVLAFPLFPYTTLFRSHEIFALCTSHDLVLQTCHLSPQEALVVIREAKAAGVKKLVCTYADYDPINMSIDEKLQDAQMGAFIERSEEHTSETPVTLRSR